MYTYSQGWKTYISHKSGQFSHNLLCIFYVQKDKIFLQIQKFSSKHQHFPIISLSYYLFSRHAYSCLQQIAL